jgi:hypothetical protein
VAVNARLRGKQPQDGQRADRLPRARLSHESQHLARRNLKAHIADGGHVSLTSGEFDCEISDLEQREHKAMLAGELRLPHSARVAVANLTEIGYNELTAFQRWRKPTRSAESPAERPAGVASCGSLLFAQSTRIQRESVCTRIAVVVTLLFVPAGRKNHALVRRLRVEPRCSAGVAQLVEHLICNQRVGGSNPFASSRIVTVSAPQGVAGASQTRRAALLEN